ncbi:hypothetical protein KQI63_16545 [bacterium]|nr:hypothetical protein [bacterium]
MCPPDTQTSGSRWFGVALFLVLLLPGMLQAEEREPNLDNLYYHGYSYGTEASFNPFSMTIGYSMAIMQITNRNNNLAEFPFYEAHRNLMWNLERPGYVIGKIGWDRFLRTEVIPTSVRMTDVQYWPNYKLHLIGGGMLHVAATEYFEYHGYPYPHAWSLAANIGMHYLNEVMEIRHYDAPTVDPIADLYIFGPAAYILFSNPRVATFFAHDLNLTAWPFQAVYVPGTGELLNSGMKFSFKYFLPWADRYGIFYLTGTEGMVGGSYRLDSQNTISVGGGWAVKDIKSDVTGSNGVRVESATLIVTSGIFLDRNNSLLASVIFGGARGYKTRLNVYPGVLTRHKWAPGFTVLIQEHNQFAMGLSWTFSPIGLASKN